MTLTPEALGFKSEGTIKHLCSYRTNGGPEVFSHLDLVIRSALAYSRSLSRWMDEQDCWVTIYEGAWAPSGPAIGQVNWYWSQTNWKRFP